MALVTTQVGELTHERRVLLDRLATLGLGGPLFSSASSDDSSETADPVDPEAEEMENLLHRGDGPRNWPMPSPVRLIGITTGCRPGPM